LEEFARRDLFVRDRKQLVLNHAGREYYERLVTLLDELEAETVKLVTIEANERTREEPRQEFAANP
jgi:DNA-binding transcriptional LysR family regulator